MTTLTKQKKRTSLYLREATLKQGLFFICGWALIVVCVVVLDESHREEFHNNPIWRHLANSLNERQLRVDAKKTYQTICQELQDGSRQIDTIFANNNVSLKVVGEAIKDCFSGDRSDLFLLSKVQGHADYKVTMARHKRNLLDLGVDYVDLLVIYHDYDPKFTKHAWKATDLMVDNSREARSIVVDSYQPKNSQDSVEFVNFYPTRKDPLYEAKAKEAKEEVLTALKSFSSVEDDEMDPVFDESEIEGNIEEEV